MKTDSIIQSKTIMSGREIIQVSSNDGKIKGRDVIVIKQNNQSFLKGLIWGVVGFKAAGITLTGTAVTVLSSPLIVTPLVALPIASGIVTYGFYRLTESAVRNAVYHLGKGNSEVIIVPR